MVLKVVEGRGWAGGEGRSGGGGGRVVCWGSMGGCFLNFCCVFCVALLHPPSPVWLCLSQRTLLLVFAVAHRWNVAVIAAALWSSVMALLSNSSSIVTERRG